MIYRGACHCGAVRAEYATDEPVRLRADGCGFCSTRGVKSASDPEGTLAVTSTVRLNRYRFGHKTADFVFCGRCGGYLGAVTEEGGQTLMVINTRSLDPRPDGLPAARPMSYEGETSGDRNARRSERWTPVRN